MTLSLERPDADDLPHTEWKCEDCGFVNSCLDGDCQNTGCPSWIERELERNLRACPFCDSRAAHFDRGEYLRLLDVDRVALVVCGSCGAQGPYHAIGDYWPTMADAQKAAAEHWNGRV